MHRLRFNRIPVLFHANISCGARSLRSPQCQLYIPNYKRIDRVTSVNRLCFSTSQPCHRLSSPAPRPITRESRRSKPLRFSLFGSLFGKRKTPEWARELLEHRLKNFQTSSKIRRKCNSMGIPSRAFRVNSEAFAKAVLAGEIPRINPDNVLAVWEEGGAESVDKLLLPAFYEFAKSAVSPERAEAFSSLCQISDLRYPAEWFPATRAMRRKIIAHVGPTNSGKTYSALNRLEHAERGIYCGPLRLLAHEIFERMNAKGVPCNLITGEQRQLVSPDAPLTSSTVEMTDLNKWFDVAVIDEIQLLGDRQRGWAWTHALLGLQAEEIHLCGEPSAVPLIQSICASMNEEVEVRTYERLSPLNILDKSLHGNFKNIRKGDCIVTFSRSNIFAIKKAIEETTGLRCAVAYGGLPPETRSLQAKLFNDPNSGFDVLVASDAVGMGLNLSIRRIVFETLAKFDGTVMRPVSVSQIKQIAGRAGRFGTPYDVGEVTTFHHHDLKFLHKAMEAPIAELEVAGLQPTMEIVELFAHQLPNEKFSSLIQKFEDLARLDGDYFLCNFKDNKILAEYIDHLDIPITDRYQFVMAPAPTRDPLVMSYYLKFATIFSNGRACLLEDHVRLPEKPVATMEKLKELESLHRTIMLYMWLSARYRHCFGSAPEEVQKIKTQCEEQIDETLRAIAFLRQFRNKRRHGPSKSREEKTESGSWTKRRPRHSTRLVEALQEPGKVRPNMSSL
ncbi:uncharacterized protein VTP21DRAFT_3812 [Calcarisporiella thermophila]|uniref:uncharacterized protein n=1 Tax=Calcarisporiella thermophila TaxID=911321 RepID=UPI0037429914